MTGTWNIILIARGISRTIWVHTDYLTNALNVNEEGVYSINYRRAVESLTIAGARL